MSSPMTLSEAAISLVVGLPIAAAMYWGFFRTLEWFLTRHEDDPNVPRYLGNSRRKRDP